MMSVAFAHEVTLNIVNDTSNPSVHFNYHRNSTVFEKPVMIWTSARNTLIDDDTNFLMKVENALEELEHWESLPEFDTVEDLFNYLDTK